jgi:hypothetical protein
MNVAPLPRKLFVCILKFHVTIDSLNFFLKPDSAILSDIITFLI